MTETCETCKHWKSKQPNAGECCIRAPQVIPDPDGGMPYTWFPYTLSDQGCGEHEPKPTDIDNPTNTTEGVRDDQQQTGTTSSPHYHHRRTQRRDAVCTGWQCKGWRLLRD